MNLQPKPWALALALKPRPHTRSAEGANCAHVFNGNSSALQCNTMWWDTPVALQHVVDECDNFLACHTKTKWKPILFLYPEKHIIHTRAHPLQHIENSMVEKNPGCVQQLQCVFFRLGQSSRNTQNILELCPNNSHGCRTLAYTTQVNHTASRFLWKAISSWRSLSATRTPAGCTWKKWNAKTKEIEDL